MTRGLCFECGTPYLTIRRGLCWICAEEVFPYLGYPIDHKAKKELPVDGEERHDDSDMYEVLPALHDPPQQQTMDLSLVSD